jgi:hypothetical protein
VKISSLRLLILFLLLLSLPGCRSTSEQRFQTAFAEANKISDQQIKVMNEWAREFSQVFTEQNRARFPGNRDWLNSRAQKILPLMDQSSRLSNEAIEKYEEASRLMDNDQHRRGLAAIAASFRKSGEIEQLFKAQAQLPSDRTITDANAFNEKFAYFNKLIQQKQKEKDDQFDEGKRLLLTFGDSSLRLSAYLCALCG